MSKSCFFIGHRDSPCSLKPLLLDSIHRHITEYGVKEFYVGHCGAFDSMAACALSEMKKQHPHIKNYLLLAYHPAVRSVDVPEDFECSILMEGQEKSPPRYAIANLNRRMIRETDYLIAYVWKITAGSYKLLEGAIGRGKRVRLIITNLADKMGDGCC